MKLYVKIVIGVLITLLCAALVVCAVFFVSELKTRIIYLAAAVVIAFIGLILGIFMSQPKWLKIVYASVVLLILIATVSLLIRGCSVMGAINDGAVATVVRPEQNATHAPRPSLEPIEQEPSEDSFYVDLPDSEADPDSTPVPIYKKEQTDDDIVNILVLGQDSDRLYNGYGRSDVTMLLSYDRTKGTIKLLSFMRDSYIPIEGHGWNKLNTCIRFGGPGLIINTLNDLYDLDMQLYVTLAFEEFTTLVDNIGGIDVVMSHAEASFCGASWAGESTPTHMTGRQALSYVRNRRTGQGDFSRTERQRKFMIALYRKLRSDMSVNTMLELVNFSEEQIRTNMSFIDISNLALELLDSGEISIQQGRMPFDGTWHYGGINGASVVVIDIEQNKELIHQYLYGE